MTKHKEKGVSLVKGPVALIGLAMLAYGVTAFIFGGHSFSAHPISGTVSGKNWLGLEVNAWSSLLFIGAGALLLFGSPAHWTAKSVSLIVGIVLLAAAVIAAYDKTDVFGIFAANGITKLVWAAAGALLILLSLLPRIGGKKEKADERPAARQPAQAETREPAIEREGPREPARFARKQAVPEDSGSGGATDGDAPVASGATSPDRNTRRRRR